MTVREFYPPGYDPTLDRLPPRRFSCRGLFVLLAIIPLLACGGIIFFLSQRLSSATIDPSAVETAAPTVTAVPMDGWIATGTALALNPPTATPTASPTLDAWQQTGTALYLATATLTPSPTLTNTPEPTLDYCWFLTPSPTPSNTPVFVTPDAWAATGTAVFMAANTPTQPRPPTQPPPRVLCDAALEMLLNPTAAAPQEWPTPLPSFTWLPAPTQQPVEQPPMVIVQTQIVEVESVPETIYITSEPMIVERPVQVVVTQQVIIEVPVVTMLPPIIITATPMPTNTATATLTPSPTLTATPSPTFTSTFTATATNTATEIPPETTPEMAAP